MTDHKEEEVDLDTPYEDEDFVIYFTEGSLLEYLA